MNNLQAIRAARNNAVWCDLVSKAHGGETLFSAAVWWNRRQSPPYYPNAITLDPTAAPAGVLSTIEELIASPALAEFTVKDSFCALELTRLNFSQLFEASWILKAPAQPLTSVLPVRWAIAHSPGDLAVWEAAWWRSASPGDSAPKPVLFPAALLAAPGAAFLAGYLEDHLIAGCVLALSDDVVGLSCSFHETADPVSAESDLVSEIHRLHPNRSIVSYESGERLRVAQLCGFAPVGTLRVWLRPSPHVEA
jgi:hypothetical protein